MNNPILSSKYRLKIFQRAFFIFCITFLGVFVSTPELHAQNSSPVGDIFKNNLNSQTADQEKAENFMSDIMWWIRLIALFIVLVIFVVFGVLYASNQVKITALIPCIIAAALIGGGVEIFGRLFFDVGGDAAR